jgi:hypothetical protein
MKILFVGFNAKYINPTSQLVHKMLRLCSEVIFYGPGFVSAEELRRGLESFAEIHAPFDFIITSSQLAAVSDPILTADFYRRYCLSNWGPISVRFFMEDARRFMLKAPQAKIVFALDLDPYAVPSDYISQLDEFSDYIVSLGKGFTRSNDELRYLTLEKSIARKAKRVPLGLWHDYCETHVSKFISLGHFVGVHEFDFSSIVPRKYSVSVAGQPYFFRVKTLNEFSHDRRLKVGYTSYRWLFSLFVRLGISPYSRPLGHAVYRTLFKQLLVNSKISMTDGGAYEYLIRKFVEVPASGALLLARPCMGFESLGFSDGVSAVVIDEADPVGQVIQLLSDLDRIQKIARKGQEVVWNEHSIQARATQLKTALNAISQGDFKGSTWRFGKFVLL